MILFKIKKYKYSELRQVFNYFDKDKSGRLNTLEVDNILKRLNIQLSSDGHKQLMKELDKDGKIFLILYI